MATFDQESISTHAAYLLDFHGIRLDFNVQKVSDRATADMLAADARELRDRLTDMETALERLDKALADTRTSVAATIRKCNRQLTECRLIEANDSDRMVLSIIKRKSGGGIGPGAALYQGVRAACNLSFTELAEAAGYDARSIPSSILSATDGHATGTDG